MSAIKSKHIAQYMGNAATITDDVCRLDETGTEWNPYTIKSQEVGAKAYAKATGLGNATLDQIAAAGGFAG